jgi:catechol 2,3-dioxygenase-like lactoylglutathione lyase family enzyme
MLDHIGIPVSDLARSKQFFVAALAPLGYKVIFDFRPRRRNGLRIISLLLDRQRPAARSVAHRIFRTNRRAVDAFHKAASLPAVVKTDNRECERSTIRITTLLSCTIRTATISK